MKQSFADFYSNALEELFDSRITVVFDKHRKVKDCGGYFDDENKELVVATGKRGKRWKEVFIHEYCHFLQWKEKSPWFTTRGNDFGSQHFWSWLEDQIDLTPKQIEKATSYYRGLEHDCERRVIEYIKDRDLGFDVDKYVKTANSYIYFYSAICKDGKWCNKKSPYMVPELVQLMPTEFMKEKEYRTLPRGYLSLVREHCY